jgi:hypothetical protein
MGTGLKAALAAAWLAVGLWFAAVLLPPPPASMPRASSLAGAQLLLRRLALASSEEGMAMMPQAEIWLRPPAVVADNEP